MSVRNLQFSGAYFDGRSPRKQQVAISLTPRQLTLTLPEGQTHNWKYTDLRLSAPGESGKHPFHLEHTINESNGDRLETLVVNDPAFLNNLRAIAAVSLHPTLRPASGLKRVLLVVSVLVVPFFLYGLWTVGIPKLADQMATQVPISWEEKLGDSILQKLPPALAPSTRPEQEKALSAIAARLLSASPNQPYNIRIHISPHKMVNAVAFPGGHILIFQGLLNLAETPEELAGVLAHEIQHVVLRHSTRGILRSMASSILLTLISGDVNSSMSAVLEVAGGLEGLAHSREMERQADREGMDRVLAAGIDPVGMIRMFEKLQAVEPTLIPEKKSEDPDDDSASWTEYLSTHPAGKGRVSEMKKQVAMAGKKSYTPLLPDLNWKALFHQKVNPKESGDSLAMR
jgi:Zn-dependent protease with chaperone function